jgi:hypothetical protein
VLAEVPGAGRRSEIDLEMLAPEIERRISALS